MHDQGPAVISDGQAPIQVVPELDPRAGVAPLQRLARDRQAMASERHGIVLGHYALELGAEEILGPSASWPGRIG